MLFRSNIVYEYLESDSGNIYIPKSQKPKLGYNLDETICNIIEMNNYLRFTSSLLPEDNWLEYNYLKGSIPISEFIRDIKSSKERCLQWEGYIPFVLNFNGIETKTKCVKTEKVKFKLYLYDTAAPKDATRKITFLKDFTIVGQYVDETGRVGKKQDGETEIPSIDGDPKQSVAANLRTYYNPSTGKYESGTAQIVARMIDDLSAANEKANINELINMTVGDLLSLSKQHTVALGSAIPLINHNANPLLWGPEYGEAKGCRQTEDKKILKVINLSQKTFKQGETVLLQNIGGAWIPSSFGESDTEGTAQFGSQWAFSYLMTNADAFFINIEGNRLTYADYEIGRAHV